MAQQDETQIQLDELDTRLERLRALYEQYFCGIERIEPHVQRKDVERRVQNLRKVKLRNTASRFRFQSLVQKYTTYQTYWQRVTRQIEEGTYRRDQVRQQRYGTPRAKSDGDDAPMVEIDPNDVNAFESLDDLDEVFEPPARVEAAPVAAKPAPAPAVAQTAAQTAAPAPVPRASRVVEELPMPFSESIPPPAPAAPAPSIAAKSPTPIAPPKPAVPAAAPMRRAGLSVFGAAPGAKPAAAAAKPGTPALAKATVAAGAKTAAPVSTGVAKPAAQAASTPRASGEDPDVAKK